jgi:PKD repeat protein
MKKILSLTVLLCLSVFAQGQTWVDLMMDNEVNFYDVQEAFEEEWQGKEPVRGRGYKQFKRWENFMEPRVYPSGDRPSGESVMKALQARKKMTNSEMKSDQPWEPYGPTSWSGFGWNPGLGRVNASYVDPNDPEHLYVATPSGGLWESTDNGNSWTALTDTLVAIGGSAIAVDPNNTDLIYLATGDGNGADTYSFGVIKSEDGGETWTPTNLAFEVNQFIRCTDMVMDPNDSQKLYVSSSEGLYVTDDGGETWSQPLDAFVRDVAIHPTNSDIIYVSGTRFYKSTDGGESFDNITSGLPSPSAVNRMEMAVTPANDELVYLIAGDGDDSGFHGFYRSTNEGDSFQLMSNSPNLLGYSETGSSSGGQSWYDLAIAASPVDEDRVFVGGINVWETTNGGSSWNIKSHWVYPSNIGYTHADIHSLDFFGNTLYCGSDGGIFRSSNNGNTWEDLSEGLQITQFYEISLSATDVDRILTGTQDNGTNLFTADEGFVHLLGADGTGAAIDYTNDNILYASFQGGAWQRSTNGGFSFDDLTGVIPESGSWETPFEIHPNDPSILFAAYENVWKYENGSWTAISDFSFNTTLRTMRVAPSDPDVIMVGTLSTLYRTEDGGDTWDIVSAGFPGPSISAIEIDPNNSDRIWVGFSGYSEGNKIYYSEDGGESWENRSYNLPNVPVNCVHYLNGSEDELYVGNDIGVFYNFGSLETWNPFDEGLPNVIVNQIAFHYPTQKIVLATYGRGIWTNDFINTTELAPVANFSANTNEICPTSSITFTNTSLNATGGVEWTFEGGTPATSTESSPTVTYPSPGSYPVTIKAFNGALEDSLTIENYVSVLESIDGPYSEDFEAQDETLTDWFVTGEVQGFTWEFNPEVGYLSDNSVYLENYNIVTEGQVAFTSQLIDLSALDTAFISMRAAYAKKLDSGYEAMRVFINTDCSDEWQFKKLFTASNALPSVEPTDAFFVPQSDEDWNYLLVDNIDPEERTENFRFRIVFYPNGGNNIYLDDINLGEDNIFTAVQQPELDAVVNVFPNPTSGDVTIEVDLQNQENLTLRLLSMDGRQIIQDGPLLLSPGKHNLMLSVNSLSAGAYLLEIQGESGATHKKIIRNLER